MLFGEAEILHSKSIKIAGYRTEIWARNPSKVKKFSTQIFVLCLFLITCRITVCKRTNHQADRQWMQISFLCLARRGLLWCSTVELHFSGHRLSGSPIIRIGLALRVNVSRILQNNLPWNYRLSDQVQYSVMAYRTSHQAWSKGLDADTVHTVYSNSRTSDCQCSLFSKKNAIIQISCIPGRLAVPINRDKWSSTVLQKLTALFLVLLTGL
jgi:hypothetical protein